MTVIASGKFDDFAAPRCASGQTQGRHDRLRAGVDHANHLDARHAADQLGHLHLDCGGCAEAQALSDGLLHGAFHVCIAVAQNQRTPGADQVDVFPSVHVPHMAAQSPLQEAGIGSDGAAGPHWGIDAAGQNPLRRLKQAFRSRHHPSSPLCMAWASSLAK